MMNGKRLSLVLGLVGLTCIIVSVFLLQIGSVIASHEGPPLPADYRYWYHLGSKSIRPEGATAIGLPDTIFGNTYDAVFANDVALNDLRNGTRPFRDGAAFVAPFFKLESPVAGLDATGELAFTAVMVKDSGHFADTHGWGFEAFAPDGTRLTDLRPACVSCHEGKADNDFVFSGLSERAVSAVPAADNGVFLPEDYRSMYWRGSKVIRPDAATAIGLPADIFGNTTSSVYMNTEALGALRGESRPFPVGSLFVAEFHAAAFPVEGLAVDGDLAFTAVMLKGAAGTGDDPSTGDWKFEAFGPDGTPLKDLRGACISCHASKGSNDYVFTGG